MKHENYHTWGIHRMGNALRKGTPLERAAADRIDALIDLMDLAINELDEGNVHDARQALLGTPRKDTDAVVHRSPPAYKWGWNEAIEEAAKLAEMEIGDWAERASRAKKIRKLLIPELPPATGEAPPSTAPLPGTEGRKPGVMRHTISGSDAADDDDL